MLALTTTGWQRPGGEASSSEQNRITSFIVQPVDNENGKRLLVQCVLKSI